MSEQQTTAAPTPMWRDNRPHPLQGVGGWLALFCGVHLFLAPLRFVVTNTATFLGQSPGAPLLEFWLNVAFEGALVAFGAFVAWRLAKILPGAVRLARIYLFVVLGLLTLSLFALDVFSPPERVTLVSSMAVTLAWLIYFYRSERVRVTYSDTPKVEEVFT